MSDNPLPKAPWRRLPNNIWVLTLASFLTDVSTEMVVHLLPLFLANVLGVRTVTIGLIEGAAETVSSLLKVLSGRFSDRLGRRKWLTVAGYGLSTVAKPFLVLANSWPAVFGIRFVERMGKGVRTAPRDALIADSIEPRQRGLAFGLHRAGDTAGAAVGLLVALLVVWQLQGTALTLDRATFRWLAGLSVIPAVLAVIVLVWGVREAVGQPRPAGVQAPSGGWGFNSQFKRFMIIIVLFTLGNSADAFLVLRAQERGLALPVVLGGLLLLNLTEAAVSGPAGSLSDRLGRQRLLAAGWLFYALVYAGLALAQSGGQVLLLFALYGLYYGLTRGAAKAFVADLVAPEQRGSAYGLYNAAVGIAVLPASLLAGLLWQGLGGWPGFGPAAPFWFGALLALLAVGLLGVWLPQEKDGY